jgi:hypothetical protein
VRQTIYLALTHDWELRGDGSGEMERLQLAPLRELVRIYKRYGVRGTFNPDVMQQLTFRQNQTQHTELKALADAWDESVRDAFRQGHDVQLHIHPQWLDARYEQGQWQLTSEWSLLKYDAETARKMLASCKEYLETLLQPVDPAYRCLAFRGGAMCLAPSPHLLKLLVDLGIELDVSIIGGLYLDTRRVQLDYRECEETFLPFYPRIEDARKVSSQVEKIVCVPTHHFYGSRRQVLNRYLSIARRKIRSRVSSTAASREERVVDNYGRLEWDQKSYRSPAKRIYEKGIKPLLHGKHFISDTARLDYPLLRAMLESVRRRARQTGLREVPVILTNYPKEIRDFTHLERFIGEASQAEDIKFLTLTELAGKLRSGEFQIRTVATR